MTPEKKPESVSEGVPTDKCDGCEKVFPAEELTGETLYGDRVYLCRECFKAPEVRP